MRWFIFSFLALILGLGVIASFKPSVHEEADDSSTPVSEQPKNSHADTAVDLYDLRDTSSVVDGMPLRYVYSDYDDAYLLYYGDSVVLDDPIIKVDCIEKNTFIIDAIDKFLIVNIKNSADIDSVLSMFLPLEGFARYQNSEVENLGEDLNVTKYSLTLDYPKDNKSLQKWLAYLACKSVTKFEDDSNLYCLYTYIPNKTKIRYKGAVNDYDALFKWIYKRYIAMMKKEMVNGFPLNLNYKTDIRTHYINDKYITYRLYISGYMGGIHGMYTENLISYDLINDQPINNSYLFREGTIEKVWLEVCAELGKNEDWPIFIREDREWTPEDVADQVIGWAEGMYDNPATNLPLPEAGVVEDGFVFSFQPYVIDCFAAGCYHIKVPYSTLEPYLTPQAKALFN